MKAMKSFAFILFSFISLSLSAQMTIDLEEVAGGFTNITKIANAGDERLFVLERPGVIKIIAADGSVLPTPFLNIDPLVIATGGQSERGLLGLAFHPDYASNGYFYVHYSDNSGNGQISRFQVSATDPNQADAGSEYKILNITQPFGNHNGGEIVFGPDEYLYIGLGDGGSAGDPGNRSQNTTLPLGKMLRIDVDGTQPYSIPPDNPFVNSVDTLPEIWALGLRNPWRFSFDTETGDLWIADVGQDAYEEINFQPAGSTGGENYGWRCYEAYHNFNTLNCAAASSYFDPVWEYAHAQFGPCSVTGGFVYRSCVFPDLNGTYLYADFCSGDIWGLKQDTAGVWNNVKLKTVGSGAWTTFGQGIDGELYIAGLNNGKVYHIVGDSVTTIEIVLDAGVLSAEAGYAAYQWYLNGNVINGATEATFTPLESGDYRLEVSYSGGCTFSSELVPVVVSTVSLISGVEDFRIHPNPFLDEILLSIRLAETSDLTMEIFTIDGRRVYQQHQESVQNWQENIDLSELESGVYFLRISDGKGQMLRKLVKGKR